MTFWLLFAAMIFQESVSTSAIVFKALHEGVGWPTIISLFIIGTTIDIVIPYILGKVILTRYKGAAITRKIELYGDKAKSLLAKHGEFFGLAALGIFNFTWLNALLAPWLKLSFKKTYLYFLIGDFIWYASVLAVNLGVLSFIPIHVWLCYLLFVLLLSLLFLQNGF